jgi:membrane-associated phospholipid phosphatase
VRQRVAALLGCVLALGACAAPLTTARPHVPYAEWRAATLETARRVVLAGPPAPGSAEARTELDEVRTLQARLDAAQKARLAYWEAGTVVRWNEITRELVKRKRVDPVEASRVYALVSVAQDLAVEAARTHQPRYARRGPSVLAGAGIAGMADHAHGSVYPSDEAAVAIASALVLGHLFPEDGRDLLRRAGDNQQACLLAGMNVRSDLTAGEAVGRAIAAEIITRAQTDGAYAAGGYVALPTGPGYWTPTAKYMEPTLPRWGEVRPWFLARGDQLRPPPPPAFGSPEFKAALAEVRRYSDERAPERVAIARKWADGTGSPTPPGHWNAIAADLFKRHQVDDAHAARILAVLNMAMMDAGIGVWDAKYTYFTIRPWQADPQIFYVVPRPNFPSYVSGHSGFSGAAAEVLAHFFPRDREEVDRLASEASMSRVYGGIHYRFDCDEGLKLGRAAARLALRTYR